MSEISTKPPSGMRDFLAADVVRRRHVLGIVQRVYESFGFVPLETPTIENLSTLLGKYGPEGDQLLYRILHRREKLQRALEGGNPTELDLADEGLRYDLTVPLARVVANYRDLPQFYKRYQIQPVWRADRPQKGRFREFYQCDVDAIGSTSATVEAEQLAAAADVLARLGFTDFTIRLNHRKLLAAVLNHFNISPELHGSALVALDKTDKVGRDAVVAEMAGRGIAEADAQAWMALLFDTLNDDPGSIESSLRDAARAFSPVKRSRAALSEYHRAGSRPRRTTAAPTRTETDNRAPVSRRDRLPRAHRHRRLRLDRQGLSPADPAPHPVAP